MYKIIKFFYRFLHDLIFSTIDINPFFKKTFNGKSILKSHISLEHLKDPSLDDRLLKELRDHHIKTSLFSISHNEYKDYLREAGYPEWYYGGGKNEKENFVEKTLEHFVSTKFLNLNPDSVFIDIAACNSPFSDIIKKMFGVKDVYQQDLIYPAGIRGNKIGGYASEIPLPDESVDAVTLHCSLEHFEGNSDTMFFKEMQRLLKKGGKIVVLPFYLAHEYTIHIDPVYNFLKFHKPDLNDKKARLRYCNWYQFFSRHYSIDMLKERIVDQTPRLSLEVIKIDNYKEIHPASYLRFVGVFTKI